ncbi:MAG: hypothetical protein AAFY24_25240 [Pseudomonadota bacterium]
MDEVIMRRLRHLQWLEENHVKGNQARSGSNTSDTDGQGEEILNVLSADWNRKQRQRADALDGQKLPCGWRKEHWKTQQSMARDYAGVNAGCKDEAVRALEAYEAQDPLPPAA